ncbi:hypothetical protein [Falsirhodobacter sp. 20TX0035]|uniref:hypothetical protein n=1 Tax=Falsirhodobacter sp. 20TX0035 TaxID=3022019 RepID=UPI00232ACAEF|nr:hypothetical protein [Falsirhodobacter sp. 20TX0035]MDB6455134.1 hypothetical protein [Falsirhodobacter sp. 20TX0035]
MSKLFMLPAVTFAAALLAGPVLAQDAPAGEGGAAVVPNTTPAGPNYDPHVTKEEAPAAQSMDPPDEGTSGAPTATTGTQDLDHGTDADTTNGDTAVKPKK